MNRDFRPDGSQRGAGLIEVLIGMAVGLFILAGAFSLFSSALESGKTDLAMTNLDQELRAAMDVMVRNIRRAGYYGKEPTGASGEEPEVFLPAQFGYGDPSDPTNKPGNPFQKDGYEMTLGGTCNSDGECTCISFSYDVVDASHSCTVGPDTATWCGTHENFAFRFDSAHDAIEMWKYHMKPDCTDTDSSHWEDITDSDVEVQSLTFQYEKRAGTTAALAKKPRAINLTIEYYNRSSGCNYTATDSCASCPCGCPASGDTSEEECLQQRTVIVTIDARLARDTDTTMSIRERVKVPNDRYCTEDGKPSC